MAARSCGFLAFRNLQRYLAIMQSTSARGINGYTMAISHPSNLHHSAKPQNSVCKQAQYTKRQNFPRDNRPRLHAYSPNKTYRDISRPEHSQHLPPKKKNTSGVIDCKYSMRLSSFSISYLPNMSNHLPITATLARATTCPTTAVAPMIAAR